MRYEVMATVRVLGATFLDAAGVDERSRLARRDLALHFHPGHLLKLHEIGLRTRGSARRPRSQYQGGGAASDQRQQGIRNRTKAHVTPRFPRQREFRNYYGCATGNSTTSLFSRL